MKDRTLIVTLDDYEEADGFDRIIEFEGTKSSPVTLSSSHKPLKYTLWG